MFYTTTEKTLKKYTAQQIIDISKVQLKGKGCCTDALHKYPAGTLFTLVQLNEISDEIVSDSYYYNG